MRTPSLALLGLAGLLLLGGPAPSARAEDVAASFPAPSKEKGFSWQFNAMVGGKSMGSFQCTAEPTEDGASWHLTESAELAGAMKMGSEGVSDRSLIAQAGEASETEGGKTRSASYERNEAGYELEVTVDDGEPETKEVAVPEGASVGIVAAFLYLRLVPAAPATYSRKVMDPADEKELLRDGTIQVIGPGEWTSGGKTVTAWLANVKAGNRSWSVACDPTTRDVIGAKIDGTPVEFVPGAPVEVATIDFTKPATTAKRAALRAGFAMAVADGEILGDVTDWPAAYAAANGAKGEIAEVDAFREQVIAGLKPQGDRKQVQAMLPLFEDRLEETAGEGGRVRVKFPPEMQGLTLEVHEVDGAWKLARFP